jgi:hypothetical protein
MKLLATITLILTATWTVAAGEQLANAELKKRTVTSLFQQILTFHDRDIGGEDTITFDPKGGFWSCSRMNSFPGGIVFVDIRDTDGAYRIHGPFFEGRFSMSPRLRGALRKTIKEAAS